LGLSCGEKTVREATSISSSTLPGVSLFDLGGLQVDLEELLGIPVDLVTAGDLPEKFRNFVLKEARKT
jgi:predicted nucleotidyltransferase